MLIIFRDFKGVSLSCRMKKVIYTETALKSLARIPTNVSCLIVSKVEQYAENPKSLSRNVIKLQGRDGFRLRVGDWRVIFDEDGVVLHILEVGPRGRIYD
jgi:mRNA interferase RelE/StbE